MVVSFHRNLFRTLLDFELSEHLNKRLRVSNEDTTSFGHFLHILGRLGFEMMPLATEIFFKSWLLWNSEILLLSPLCPWVILCFENKGQQIVIVFMNFSVQRNY